MRLLTTTAIYVVFTHMTAAADAPETRYCEGEYARGFSNEDGETVGETLIRRFDSGGGDGFRLACRLEAALGVYGFGEIRFVGVDLDSVATGINDPSQMSLDEGTLVSGEWRAGLGLERKVGDDVSIYGQAGVIWAEVTESFLVFTDTLPNGLPEQTRGVDVEGGARWRPNDRLEFGAFARWSSVGSFDLDLARGDEGAIPNSLDLFVDRDVFGGGASGAWRVTGPLWVTARFEARDIDLLTFGFRASF
ncbi:MAG: hypothetical protein AAFQ67_06115 [Pseudomonadota bacterium]